MLAENIADRLREREFCLVFAAELERYWPSQRIDRAEQEKQIQVFAKSHGWSVSVLDMDEGFRAIFRKDSRYR